MLLGVGYSQDCDPVSYNCDCNEDTWQEYYNSGGHNMEGCYLAGANLSFAILSGADLFGANLEGADLFGANLAYANLVYANLMYANLEGADLFGANLAYANLSFADLTLAILFEADLSWANLCNLAGSPSGHVCEEPVTDSNGDGYDDVSYDAGAESGDLNLDGVDNVQDVVILVENILNP